MRLPSRLSFGLLFLSGFEVFNYGVRGKLQVIQEWAISYDSQSDGGEPMGEDIYSIELLHQGKYESWDFSGEEKRNEFYEDVKNKFKGHEIKDRENVEDTRIVQLSSTSLQIKKDGVSQTVPYEWYDADSYEAILEYINKNYSE